MTTTINRRNFIRNNAIGGAGLMFFPTMLSASSNFSGGANSQQNFMGGLTPVSVIDNACMLAFCSGRLSQESQNTITTDIHLRDTPGNKGRLAVAFPPNHQAILELLEIVKNTSGAKFIKEKRALAFGWIAVNAVQNHINKALDSKNGEEFKLARLHQDALVVRGFSAGHNFSGLKEIEVEKLLNSMLTRTVTRTHTLKPDSDDGIGWVNRMSEWRRQNVDNMKLFAAAIVKPNPKLAGDGFYDGNEKIIEISVQLQNGLLVKPDKVEESIDSSSVKSTYGKAISEAAKNILAADDYLNGKISSGDLKKKLNV
jgi:hypothetical protein